MSQDGPSGRWGYGQRRPLRDADRHWEHGLFNASALTMHLAGLLQAQLADAAAGA